MLKNVKIMSKILMGFGALITINILVGIVIFWNISTLNKTFDRTEQLLAAHNNVEKYSQDIEYTHALLMDYINSGDIGYAEKIVQNIKDVDAQK